MWKNKLLVVIASLSLAAMACSLAGPGNASDPPQPTPTVLATRAVLAPVQQEPSPEPTKTATPRPTVQAIAASNTDNLGILDEVSGAESSASSSTGGEAIAIESLNSLQEIEAQLYLPNCTPLLDWPLYSVVGGDTLHKIATRHGTSWQALAQANCLANPNLIYVGQALHVPPTPVPLPDGIDGNLPVIANPADPSPPGCNVFVNNPSTLVSVYDGPGANYKTIAYLYNWARWLDTVPNGYRIEFPFGGAGWVLAQDAYIAGDCGQDLPVYQHPHPLPADSCSAVAPVGSGRIARVYSAPGGRGQVIARLGNYAPVIQYAEGSFEISLTAWVSTGWVRETDIGLTGPCPNFYLPTPTHTAVPPTPTHTPTPDPVFGNLPRINNPGSPAPERCVVRVRSADPALVYPGPISTGPIAVLENYAPYVESVEGGYVIDLSSGREGWVSATDTDLSGQCFSISTTGAE